MSDDLPPVPPGVILLLEDDHPIVTHWRRHYAALVAKARGGAPTAMNVTLRWARAEVEYAQARGIEPRVNVPEH
ncbi:MAG: hypothetical protein JWR52_3491 [Marmoricola sp.]|nr:hypothetical protein [Marmoricola sp.]